MCLFGVIDLSCPDEMHAMPPRAVSKGGGFFFLFYFLLDCCIAVRSWCFAQVVMSRALTTQLPLSSLAFAIIPSPINLQGGKGEIHFSTFLLFDGSITPAWSLSPSRVLERHIQVGLLFPFPCARILSRSPCSPPR